MTRPAGDQDRGRELSRLIYEAAAPDGCSYQKLADRALDEETGARLSKPYLHKMAAQISVTAPDPSQLRGIAAALRLPLRVVQQAAAAQFFDYRPAETAHLDQDMAVIVEHLAGMAPAERRRWRAMIEAVERLDLDAGAP